jgi:predicted nuclease with TOPRIM domain
MSSQYKQLLAYNQTLQDTITSQNDTIVELQSQLQLSQSENQGLQSENQGLQSENQGLQSQLKMVKKNRETLHEENLELKQHLYIIEKEKIDLISQRVCKSCSYNLGM